MSDLCVIFDLDGTLVDSELLCNQAFVDLLPDLPDAEYLMHRFRGRKLSFILAELERMNGAPLGNDFEQRYRQRVSDLFAMRLEPSPGVPDMLMSLRFPCCVASSGPRSKIQDALSRTALLQYFEDRIFSSYEVGSWKPEPGLFLHAAAAMGKTPASCVVIEDSPVGVEAAYAAGKRVLQYLPDPDDQAHLHAIPLRSMNDLTALLEKMVPGGVGAAS